MSYRYEAYNIRTQETVAESDTIKGLAEKLYISRATVSKHIQANLLREIKPRVFAGGIVVRDTRTTERCLPLTQPKADNTSPYHIYRADTGAYITSLTISEIYNKLRLKRIGVILTAIDNHPLYEHNITITSYKHDEPFYLPGARRVHEMYDCNRTLVLSTFHPELISWWGKPLWTENPYKPNHYMAQLKTKNPIPHINPYKYDIDVADKLTLDTGTDI